VPSSPEEPLPPLLLKKNALLTQGVVVNNTNLPPNLSLIKNESLQVPIAYGNGFFAFF
jgi:hypothetical protein